MTDPAGYQHGDHITVAAVMTETAAAWVREHVWTKKMRHAYKTTPGHVHACACQWGPTQHCKTSNHTACRHNTLAPHQVQETYVCGSDGDTVLSFTERFTYPTGSAVGPKRSAAAMVWLADRACRWRCPCGCHTTTGVAPVPPPAAPEPQTDTPVQLGLFDALAS
jgi:hypothetical protein